MDINIEGTNNTSDLINNIVDEILQLRDEKAYEIIKPYVDRYGKVSDMQITSANIDKLLVFKYHVSFLNGYELGFLVGVPIGGGE
jgi:hypothetical protein